jgi:hypothetical protein
MFIILNYYKETVLQMLLSFEFQEFLTKIGSACTKFHLMQPSILACLVWNDTEYKYTGCTAVTLK